MLIGTSGPMTNAGTGRTASMMSTQATIDLRTQLPIALIQRSQSLFRLLELLFLILQIAFHSNALLVILVQLALGRLPMFDCQLQLSTSLS